MTHNTGWQSELAFLGGSQENEARLIDRFVIEIQEVARTYEKANGRIMRAQHAKMLAGFTNAEFRISSEVPEDLRVGFIRPGETYKAHVRFSNASSAFLQSDASQDLRGVALRVMVDETNYHDFLMTNAEQHHAKDAKEAMATTVAFADTSALAKLKGIVQLVARVGPLAALRIVKTLKQQMQRPVASLATEQFFSRALLAIGAVAVKYKLTPFAEEPAAEALEKSQNERRPAPDLRKELAARLKQGDLIFHFKIQRYVDAQKTPINDATKVWESPYERIAQLVIPRQDLETGEARAHEKLIENTAFNPWNVFSNEFKPVGSMNRARQRVYQASAALR
jgi:catalase